MKVAIIIETFPSKTEVPVLNQICGLIDAGLDVKIFALNNGRIEQNQLHKKILQYGLLDKTFYLGEVPSLKKSNRVLNALYWRVEAWRCSALTFFKKPELFRKALFKKEYGKSRKAFRIIFAIYPLLNLHERFDIIHCQFAPLGIWGCILRDLGILEGKVLTSFRGYGINDLPKRVAPNYYDFLLKKGDAFTANTNYTKKNATNLGFESSKIHVVHSCLDIKDFPFVIKKFEPGQCFEILSVASLKEVKGLKYSIEAVEILKRQHPELKFRYRIVGEGPLRKDLANQIKTAQLTDEVFLLGYKPQQELINIYKETHLFILPSITTENGNTEAQGLVIQEAQACGVPVIGSNTGGIPEGFMPEKSGCLVEEKNTHTIYQAIKKFIEYPLLLTEMSKAGRSFVENNFDVQIQTSNLVQIYQSLISAKSEIHNQV
jgi:colanic acid/amylovoran biosynthesis glycosyltransferase